MKGQFYFMERELHIEMSQSETRGMKGACDKFTSSSSSSSVFGSDFTLTHAMLMLCSSFLSTCADFDCELMMIFLQPTLTWFPCRGNSAFQRHFAVAYEKQK